MRAASPSGSGQAASAAPPRPVFLGPWSRRALHARVALHVVARYTGETLRGKMPLAVYPRFLYRALLFLRALRHDKPVRLGRLYKLQLYLPAYPSPAFFHALSKLYRPVPGPVSVVLSMTRACTYRCPHCYQRKDGGADVDLPLVIDVAREMQELGVSFFNIEGGEPLERPERLIALLRAIDARGESWVNTTGVKLTDELAARLRDAGLGGVMVSLHTPHAAEHDRFTGVPGSFDTACRALECFACAGVFTAINCCASPALVVSGGLARLFDLGRDLHCAFIQVIHEKSAGAWLGREVWSDGPSAPLARLRAMHLDYNEKRALRDHPSCAAQVFDEQPDYFGCTAGGVDRFYVGASGEVQPCEFLNVSFGNVSEEPFATIFARMREYFPRPGTDWLCCTQAGSIARAIAAHGLTRTPVPWEVTRELVSSWTKGGETRLYKRLGIYR